jgi:dihydrofolate synthase/folylpolyglutamate synthase
VITSIGLDHTSILGDSLAKIAYEKAGILKAGVPAVIGQMPDEALEVIEREAATLGCEVWRFGKEILLIDGEGVYTVETPTGRHAGLKPGIKGAMQPHNMALAVAACDASVATRTLGGLERGTAKARIPGRFEIRTVAGKTVVLDGAHNADAAKALIETLGESFPGRRILLVTSMIGGHDPAEFFRPFAGLVDEAFTAPIEFHRALDPAEVADALRPFVPRVQVGDSVAESLEAALNVARKEDLVLITGSFYLVGEAGRYLSDSASL